LERKTLPKKTLLLWQIRTLVFSAIFVLLCLYFSKSLAILASVGLIIAIIALIYIIWYLPTFFKGYEILLKGDAIIINYGVFIKVSHIMPYSRLIYAQSFATPIARLLRVSTLTLKAARGWIIVPELDNNVTQSVIDYLSKEAPDD